MKKTLVLALSMFLVVGFVAVADLAGAAEYDRYERRTAPPPPPPPPRYRSEPPPMRHAAQGQMYFFTHLGIFDPNDDGDGLRGYESGGNFDVGFGSRVSPLFAVEATLGGYAAENGPDEAAVVPLTIGGRLIIPHPFIEPYLGGGIGMYFSSLDEPSSTIDDTSTDFGGYLSVGADFWLNQRVALNFEGKYHWVEPSFDLGGSDVDVDMSGWTANLGVRISF